MSFAAFIDTLWMRRPSSASVAACGVVALAAIGLKAFYAQAGAGSLGFILTPSCELANLLGGLTLVPEAGAGYVMHAPRMIVGASCAGMNFLVIAWVALFLTTHARFSDVPRKLGAALVTGFFAYLATILTNGVRIALAAELYARELETAALTPEGAHRLLGVVLYLPALLGLCRLADRWVNRAAFLRLSSLLVPFLLYLGVTLLLPLIHHAAGGRPDGFFEHAAVTISVGTVVLLAFALASHRSRVGTGSDGSA